MTTMRRVLVSLVFLAGLASGCVSMRSQEAQVAVLRQVRDEFIKYHRVARGQIEGDKTGWLDMAFRVDLADAAAKSADGKLTVAEVTALVKQRGVKDKEVRAGLVALDNDFAQRLALIDRGIELGKVTLETLSAWAQVQAVLRAEAQSPVILPALLGKP